MKNLLLVFSIILLSISCSKKEAESDNVQNFTISGNIDGETISVEANACKTAGWTGRLKSVDSILTIWETNWAIQQGGHEFYIEFQIHDSLTTFNKNIAAEYFFARDVEPSLFPKFFSTIRYSDGIKNYSSTPEWWEGISQDFQLEIEEVFDLDYIDDCTELAPMIHLKGNFSGPLINISDTTDIINVSNGAFDVILRRYE